MPSRSEIEKEVQEDLSKSDVQILVDIHEEILRNDRSLPENLIHAQKRLASLFINLSRQAEKLTKETLKLNKRLLYLTWVIAILTAVILLVNFFELPKIAILINHKTTQTEQNTQQDNNTRSIKNNNKLEPGSQARPQRQERN